MGAEQRLPRRCSFRLVHGRCLGDGNRGTPSGSHSFTTAAAHLISQRRHSDGGNRNSTTVVGATAQWNRKLTWKTFSIPSKCTSS